MKKRPVVALMLALSLVLGSVSVGATENTASNLMTQTLETESEGLTEEREDVSNAETVSEDVQISTHVWKQEDGRAYLCDENGNRVTVSGTPIVDGEKYFVGADGYLLNGWLILGDWKMYFDTESYTATKGCAEIDGKTY